MVAALVASPPVGAATVTLSDHWVFNCCSTTLPFSHLVAPGDLIQVTPIGWLDAPPQSTGAAIDLSAYRLDNAGRIRAFFGSEVQGFALGPGNNLNSGLIEAASFSLTGGLLNTGTLITGAASDNTGTLVSFASGGPFAQVAASANLENDALGNLDIYGQMQVQGRLENAGTLRAFATGDSFLQVGGGFAPGPASTFLNVGQASFATGTQLNNNARVDNFGSLTLEWGSRMRNAANAEFVNRAGSVFDLGGTGAMPPLASTFVENRGSFDNQAGGVMEVRALTNFSSFQGTLSNAGVINVAGDMSDFDLTNTGALHLSGRLTRGLVANSGSITVQGGGNSSELFVQNLHGGTVQVDAGGTLTAELTGSVVNGVVVRGRLEWTGGSLGGVFDAPPAVLLSVQAGGQLAFMPSTRPLLDRDGILVNQGEAMLAPSSHFEVAGEVRNAGQLLVMSGSILNLRPSAGQGTLTNEAGGEVVVQGQVVGSAAFPPFERGGTIVNRGEFRIVAGGAVGPAVEGPMGDFYQDDGRLVIESGAELNAKLLTMSGGTLMGTGRINGDVFIQGNAPLDPLNCASAGPGVACFRPGFSPGHMDIGGHLSMGRGSVLELEVGLDEASGLLAWDRVTAGSMSFLDGALIQLVIGPGVDLSRALTLSLLTCQSGPCDFSGSLFDAPGSTDVVWQVGANGLSVRLSVAAVPEPGTVGLWCLGLAAMAHGVRRRRSRAA